MAEYDAFGDFLENTAGHLGDITLSFDQIGRILARPLPAAAYKYRPWWGNERLPTSHVQAESWQRAGFVVDKVNMKKEWVRFRRI